jgi:hypothetical protein
MNLMPNMVEAAEFERLRQWQAYEAAKKVMPQWVREVDHGACLVWAMAAMAVLPRFGLKPCIQAGSMSWPMDPNAVPPKPTHFGYEWTPGQRTSDEGLMPEIHVWVGLTRSQEIVDFSTSELPAKAKLHGVAWSGPKPPPFLWVRTKGLPVGVHYRPFRDATLFAYERIKMLWRETR